ncbi:histone-lysine N-methyltransferase SETMAR [Trichonephila clavipes]|nr:histone-lysine N-methyltransferase SETMAR [Trichonephila clavipes]
MYGFPMFSQSHLCHRIDVCDSLLKRHENDPFLKRIIMEQKKMNRLKPFPKPIFTKKSVYCHKLDRLNDALQQKRSELTNRKGVVFHHDNARPHTSLVTRQKLLQLEWDTMQHSPYSPDLAPSDYYLFRSLQNFLDGKTFSSNEENNGKNQHAEVDKRLLKMLSRKETQQCGKFVHILFVQKGC